MSDQATDLTVLSVLKAGHWFSGLDDTLLKELAQLSHIKTYASQEIIFSRGQLGAELYGIISGSVRVMTESVEGRELALNTMHPGDIGGEIAALDGGERTASWVAIEPTTVFVIARTRLHDLMMRKPSLALHMINVLCQRVRNTSQQVEDAAFLSVPERLAQQLAAMVAACGSAIPCRVDISQRELAAFLSASRQVVNGTLQDWQRQELIAVGRGYVEVLDLEGMLDAAEHTESNA